MKTISLAEFTALTTRHNWKHEQNTSEIDRCSRQIETWCEESHTFKTTDITRVWAVISKTSTLDDIKIIYSETRTYDEYSYQSLLVDCENEQGLMLDGFIVINQNGDEISEQELINCLDERFIEIDCSALESKQVIDIDIDTDANKDSKMKTHTLTIDNAPNIRFTGELIAEVSSEKSVGRWTELFLYKTKGGKFICHEIGRSQWLGENTRFTGKACETEEEVKAFFGHRWLAKALYRDADIDDVIDVE